MNRSPATLEQRLRMLESELRKANQRARVAIVMFGGSAILLLVLGLVRPTPGAAPATFTTPFQVVAADGRTVFSVRERPTGGEVDIFNSKGNAVVAIGTTKSGGGGLSARDAGGKYEVFTGIGDGQPRLELSQGGKKLAEVAPGLTGQTGLRIWSARDQSIVVAEIETSSGGNGYLGLFNRSGLPRVEGGVTQVDHGNITVWGPSGKCRMGLGVPCEIDGR